LPSAQDPGIFGVVDRTAAPPTPRTMPPKPDAEPDAAPDRMPDWEAFYRDYRKPDYVPGFEITSQLGGGAFGLVYRARRMSIGKDYAIKFLRVEDAAVRRAVLSELSQVGFFAQIDHPNLVSIEDKGEVDGIPFLVMAFAGTSTLRDELAAAAAGGRPEPERRRELLGYCLQACRGLLALHERSLVHFDIKPANVFLKGPVARLGDYGLSKLVTHSRGSLSMGRGTPYYMAPELLQRRGDHRSDIYSMGVVLYEVLCGEPPFRGDSEWEVLRQHESAAPPWPDHLTRSERTILQRCLEKDPAKRFQSVADLIAAFGAEVGVGAAALREPSAPSGGKPDRGAKRTSPPPPLPPKESEPFRWAADVSRDAFKTAQKAARHAMREAQAVAQEAARGAQTAWREMAGSQRKKHERRREAHRRLQRQRAMRRQRERAEQRARRGIWPTLFVVATLLVVTFLGLFWIMVARSDGLPVRVGAWSGPVPQQAPQPSSRQTFRVFRVPQGMLGQVTTGEPRWVAIGQRDPDAAHAELERHLARVLEVVDARRTGPSDELPTFELREGVESLRRYDALVDALVERHDPRIAEQLTEAGPGALARVAERLAQLDWKAMRAPATARRLHEVLVEATGCDAIPLFERPGAEPAELAVHNSIVASLWLWFLNEFGHTDRAWSVYRGLRR
jgi:serine/threonine protein kinase